MAEVEFRLELDQAAIESLAGGPDVERALEVAGQIGETSAKQHVAVDTANLQRSITHEVTMVEGGGFVRIGSNVEYAIFQEVGTIFHPAHPYLRPAMESIRREF